jgi:hypothetical protein
MVIADDRKKSSRTLHLQANIDGIITIAEDMVCWPEGVKLLVGSSFLITVPETGVDMYAEAKAHSVYSVTIVAKPRILIEGRISHDEVPLTLEIGLGHPDYHKYYLRIQVDRRR